MQIFLKKLESKMKLHPALKSAFSNLYGYSSDEGGIRHAMIERDSIDFTDAKFMLVACSAFINFVNIHSMHNKGMQTVQGVAIFAIIEI